jgi:predicted ABC-type ATPase
MTDKDIERLAWEWAKNKKNIQSILLATIGDTDYSGLQSAAAVFMAGSPGAGKTEIAKELMRQFSPEPVRIDADDFRNYFPGYNGTNAHLFQQAATTMVQKILDRIFDTSRKSSAVPFILDGTFSYAKTRDNVKRALKHGYSVDIYYVYQKPDLAWQFTKAREIQEGRIVPADVFAHAFVQARDNVIEAKKLYGSAVNVSVIMKDNDAKDSVVYVHVTSEELARLVNFDYNEDTIKSLIGEKS